MGRKLLISRENDWEVYLLESLYEGTVEITHSTKRDLRELNEEEIKGLDYIIEKVLKTQRELFFRNKELSYNLGISNIRNRKEKTLIAYYRRFYHNYKPITDFCEIPKEIGEPQKVEFDNGKVAYIIEHDEDIIATLNLFPYSIGNIMIITRDHYEDLLDIPRELRVKIYKKLQQYLSLLEELFVKGDIEYSIGLNIGPYSGRSIPHIHFQLILLNEKENPEYNPSQDEMFKWIINREQKKILKGGRNFFSRQRLHAIIVPRYKLPGFLETTSNINVHWYNFEDNYQKFKEIYDKIDSRN